MKRLLMSAMLFASVVGLGACNTIAGMGKDTQETGEVMTGTHPRDAYNWDARDF
jgi:predicted small secreted protein